MEKKYNPFKDKKSISVVAKKKDRQHAIKLAYLISKKEGLKSTFVNEQLYFQNEYKRTLGNTVIFIGKNKTSNPYIKIIEEDGITEERFGVKCGYCKKTAAIYLTNYTKDVKFDELFELYGTKKDTNYCYAVYPGWFKKFYPAQLVAFFVYFGPIGILIQVRAEIILNKIRYRYGIDKFMKDMFDNFIKTENNE